MPRVQHTLTLYFLVSYRGAGIDAAEDAARGWDHGVFVPLKLAFPAAALPVVELSVLSSLDPEARALCVQCKGDSDMKWFGPLVSGPVLCMLPSLGHIVHKKVLCHQGPAQV